MSTNQHIPVNKPSGIISNVLELFRRPFPVMEDWEMRWLVIGFHGVFIAAFLIFFKPFQNILGTNNVLITAGYGLVVSLILAINHFIISKILPIDIKQWTIGKSALWTLHDIFSVTLWVFIYHNIWCNFENFTIEQFFNIGYISIVLAIIPLMISTVLLENWLLRRNLQKANRMQLSVDSNAANLIKEQAKSVDEFLTLFADNKSEWIKLRPSTLIFLESTDNYVSIFYKEKDQIQKKLLRSTLTKIEEQISLDYIQRCHRSYLLNLGQIKYVDGNSRGLQLQLLDTDKVIPVSRKYVKGILAKIEEKN